jgi:hypothetical protein
MRDMELLLFVLLVAAVGAFAEVSGADSRETDPRLNRPSW